MNKSQVGSGKRRRGKSIAAAQLSAGTEAAKVGNSIALVSAGLLLLVLVLVSYSGGLSGGFIWDDDVHVTTNPGVVGGLGLKWIWTTSAAVYYPLVSTSFWLGHLVWGLNSWYFHLLNVVVHGVGAVVLWRVLVKLGVAGAWLGAALWALHPMQVESVAWITELKNTQSGVFYLLAVLYFLKWRGENKTGERSVWGWWYGVALVLAVLAILSKASTVMLPVVLGLCWWWQEKRWRWGNSIWLAPFLLVSGAASAWTIWEQKFHSGAVGAEWAQSGLERLALAGKVTWFYFWKLLWPHPLVFIYPRWQLQGSAVWLLLPTVAAGGLWLVLWWWRQEPRVRPLFFGWSYFLVSLFPVMGFFNVYFFRYSFVGDHFQYLASMGILALVGAGLSQLPQPLTRCSLLLLPLLGALTWQQTRIYHDETTLWQDTLRKNPNAWIAHNNLANALNDQKKFSEAAQHSESAIRLEPDFPEPYVNLGISLAGESQLSGAIEQFAHALRLKRDYPQAEYNLGLAFMRAGNMVDAIVHYKRALQFKPTYAEADNNLGAALARQGDQKKAISYYERALKLKPDYAEAKYNLGLALVAEGDFTRAILCYEEALRINGDYVEAMNSLAYLLATAQDVHLRDEDEAVFLSERANQLTGGRDPLALGTLAVIYAQGGRMSDATTAVQRAIEQAKRTGNVQLQSILEQQLEEYRRPNGR